MNAEVTLDDGTVVRPSNVSTDDFDKIKNKVPGTYEVTFSYTTEDGRTISVTKTITIPAKPNGGSSSNGNSNNGNPVKTGDNTPIAFLVLIMILSICGTAGIIVYRRKQQC